VNSEEGTINLGFVVLYVQDVQKMEVFYTHVLGLSVVEEVSSATFVTLRSGGDFLLALQDKTVALLPPAREDQPGSVELSFAVDDGDATWKRGNEQGVHVVADPVDVPFGRYFQAQDQEDHWLSAYCFAQQPQSPPTAATKRHDLMAHERRIPAVSVTFKQ
jgi:predicted enzyme related to lactoylglutathione lyase